MPDLVPGVSMSEELDQELSTEVACVRERAPTISICRPPLRPNTRLAIATLLSVEDVFPDKASELRTAVFRALWQEGLDISNSDVLRGLLDKGNIDMDELPAPYYSKAKECFDEWDQANYRRIPALRAPTGTTYLGLGDAEALKLFMGSALFDMTRPGNCTPH